MSPAEALAREVAIDVPATTTFVEDVPVRSKLLGDLEVLATQIYHFPQELYGFAGARTFALLPAERLGFFWLQSLDFEALTFLLIDPFLFVEGYSVDVGDDELGALSPMDPSELLVLSIVTLPREVSEPTTVNLQGPLILNIVKRQGRQVVVESPFGIRHPVNVTQPA